MARNDDRDRDYHRTETWPWLGGFALGVLLGVAIGLGTQNLGVGIAIGVALGIPFGAAWQAEARRRHRADADRP